MDAECNVNKTLAKYYICCLLATIPCITMIIAFCTIYSNLWSIIVGVLIYFLFKLIIRIIANNTLASVLFKDLDPQKFNKIINSKYFSPPIGYRINGAIYSGDYQAVVNIATNKLQKNSSAHTKYACLVMLASVYFELRDFEKLKNICEKYKEYYHENVSFRKPYSLWSYYQYFLNGNYEACITICNERKLMQKDKSWNSKINTLLNEFYYAVACYQKGDIEIAEKEFKNIVETAPKINLAKLSSQYLSMIKRNEIPSTTGVSLGSDFVLLDSHRRKKRLILKVINISSIVIFVALAIVNSKYKDPGKEFEKKLNKELSSIYQHYSIIECFNFYDDNGASDAICVVQGSSETYDVGFLTTIDAGKTFDYIIAVNDIIPEKYYCIKSPTVSARIIGLKMYYDISDVPKNASKVIQIKLGGSKAWICFDRDTQS